ncbi:MAG: helix-turn-helix transcriptional regulator [Ruminococcaceae bacterium]|nr:helix-turn-helix transcriptional regulator [Oscillospiraceae bacterium]
MYNLEEMINRIKALKKEKKLSNEALSSLSGVPKGTLAKILGSETKDPQISNIIKISQALGVSADFIIFGKEELKNNNDFLNLFSLLNTNGQNKVIEYMRDLINSGNYTSSNIVSDMVSVISNGESLFGSVRTEQK